MMFVGAFEISHSEPFSLNTNERDLLHICPCVQL